MLKIIAKRHFVLIALCFLYSASAFSFDLEFDQIKSGTYEVSDHAWLKIKNNFGFVLLDGDDSDQMEVRAINLSSTPVEIKIESQANGSAIDVSVISDSPSDKKAGLIIKVPRNKLAQLLVNSEKGPIAVRNIEASSEIGIYTQKGKVNLEKVEAGKHGQSIQVQAAKPEDVTHGATRFEFKYYRSSTSEESK